MTAITTYTPALHAQRHPPAAPGLRALRSGPDPVRMTPMARPDSTMVRISRASADAADTYSPANPGVRPGTPRVQTGQGEIPIMRDLPGALRVQALNPGAEGAAMAPLVPHSGPPRLGPLADTAALPAPQTPSTAPAAIGAFAPSSFGRGLSAQRSFAEALGAARHADALDAREGRSKPDQAREAAEQLVSTTLILPVLKQLRESNNAAPPFAPTDAEKQFGALLDHRLAHDIVKGANFPMVDRLARDLLRNQGTNP